MGGINFYSLMKSAAQKLWVVAARVDGVSVKTVEVVSPPSPPLS